VSAPLRTHDCAILTKRVFGIKLTRETPPCIKGVPLAASQASVGKRMTFSRLRLQKGASPLQMWRLVICTHKAVRRKPEPFQANKSGIGKDYCGQKRLLNSEGRRTDKSCREAGKQQGPSVGFRQRIPRNPSSLRIPQHASRT
jgi:hypothetical protein